MDRQANILFGSPYDEERYQQGTRHLSCRVSGGTDECLSVIQQCGLEHDLSLFDYGDETEVGERGLTLRHVIMRAKCAGRLTFTRQRRTEGGASRAHEQSALLTLCYRPAFPWPEQCIRPQKLYF